MKRQEDLTFERLKKGTFEDAMAAWYKHFLVNGSVDDASAGLEQVGWKKNEFYNEWNKRTSRG